MRLPLWVVLCLLAAACGVSGPRSSKGENKTSPRQIDRAVRPSALGEAGTFDTILGPGCAGAPGLNEDSRVGSIALDPAGAAYIETGPSRDGLVAKVEGAAQTNFIQAALFSPGQEAGGAVARSQRPVGRTPQVGSAAGRLAVGRSGG